MGRHAGPDTPSHALVVGGTGMLAGACLGLAERGWIVSVVGRRRSRLALLAGRHSLISPIAVDYRDHATFRAALEHATTRHGPFALAVCWIRSWEATVFRIVCELLGESDRLVHVLGSATLAALASEAPLRQAGARDTRVVLGRVQHGSGWRWLTHDEISSGVLSAVDSGSPLHVVGVLEP